MRLRALIEPESVTTAAPIANGVCGANMLSKAKPESSQILEAG